MENVLRVGIAVCIAGCGHPASPLHTDGSIPTGGDGSDGSDGGVVAVRGTVHVTVLDPTQAGVPAPGVPVVYVDPDGTVVAAIDTDINGKSQGDVLPGGSVTTVQILPERARVQLRTTLGVAPGDDLVIGSVGSPSPGGAGSFTVHWPAAPGNPTGYNVYGPCGLAGLPQSPTLSVTFSVTAACAHDPMEILVWAHDDLGHTIAFNDGAAIPFVPGGSATLPDAWSSGMGFRASYINLAGVSDIDFERRATAGEGFLSLGFASIHGGASATAVMTVPSVAVSRMHSSLFGTTGGSQEVWQAIAGDAPAYTLDGADALLAWLTELQPDASGQRFHVGRITAGTSSAAADLLELDLSWFRNGTSYLWSVFGPDASDVPLPALPSSLGAGLHPMPGDSVRATAILYEADTLAGYDAVRASIDKVLSDTFQDMRRSNARRARTSASRSQDVGVGL